MNDLDKKIREALRTEDAELFDDFGGEPSVFDLMLETFRGRHWWLSAITAIWSLVFFVLAVISAVKAVRTEDPREMTLWALAFVFCILAVSMLKMWFFMEMNKNAITREIKRLELQIARLASRIKD